MSHGETRIEAVFLRALEIPSPPERAAYLQAACAGDDELRRRVERMLAAQPQLGSFLDQNAAEIVLTTHQSAAERPGAQIGPYKLLQQIGEGGMGAVYMAEQTRPVRRQVALKVIKPGMDSRQVVARFEAERQALAMMDHVNIARVLDAGATESGRPYFVMELVHGVPITKYCDDNQLTPRERLELFVPVCQAIQHAHQKGVIHRDVKPSNVMITLYDGKPVPKVIDFGVAKATEQRLTERTLFTQYGALVGTLEYMSPEQAEMSALGVDTRSDIYSLGVLLYELLTGSTPLTHKRMKEAAYAEILRMIKEEEPPKPSTRLSDSGEALASISANRHTEPAKLTKLVRGELDWIVMKTLEKDRNRRYETANGFAADVQRYLNNEAVQACPPSVSYRMRKFVRRNQRPVLAAALVALALVGGIIGTTWNMIRATDARAVAVDEAKQKGAALAAAEKSQRDAKEQLFLALFSQARAGRFSRQMGQRLDSLAALAKAARIRPEEHLRDEAIAAMALPDIRVVPGWHASPPAQPAVAYGRQYRLYARMDEAEVISVRTIPGDREVRRIVSGPILGTYLHFSPDDRFLFGFGEGGSLRVWRVADGQPMLQEELRACHALAFSPDGRQLAVGQQDWVLRFDLATSQEVNRWRVSSPPHSLAFHPDNRRVAVGYLNPGVASVYDATSGALIADLPVGGMSDQVVAWHPHGERLAVAGSDPRIQIWNVPAKRKVATLEGHVQDVKVVTFHPDGDLMATHGWDGMLLLWDSSTGRQLMRLISVTAPQFSTDGRWLGVVWGARGADLLEVSPSREYRTLVGSASTGPGGYNHGDVSPDGRMLAMASGPGACLWDLHSGRELAALPAGSNDYVSFDNKGEGEGNPVTPNSPRWSLLTSGSDGVLRWPVRSDDPKGTRLRLGPPRQISPLEQAWFAHVSDGGMLGVMTKEGGANKILDLETGTVRRELGVHSLGEVRALSGNGRWAASCGWHSDRVCLWNVATGERVHEWVLGKRTFVFFTPDSRTLVISRGDEFSFWDVETLRLIRRLPRDVTQFPGQVAFSPDGRLMALEMAPAVIHLKEAATGRTVAKLEDPHGDRAAWLGFTPDGARLLVAANYASAIHIWDLRAIRLRLKGIGLDWDWPEFPSAEKSDEHGQPFSEPVLTVQIIESDALRARFLNNRAHALRAESKLDAAVAAYREAVDLDPRSPRHHDHLGHALRDQGDVEGAISAFEEVGRLQPDAVEVQFELASVLALSKRWDRSARVYSEALRRLGAEAWPGPWYEAIRSDEVFTRLTALRPDDRLPWIMRARLHVFQHEWKRAAADYARASESWASVEQAKLLGEGDDLMAYACLHLLLGDRPGYERFCKTWADRVGHAPGWEYSLARAWAVSSRTVVPSQQIVEWARKTVHARRDAWYLHVLSLAHYRNGEFDLAIERAKESNAANWRGNAKALNWLVLAMAHSHLGQAAEAQTSLDQARILAGRASPMQHPGVEWPDMTPSDLLEFELLRREADDLIHPSSRR
jgi:eukaryotic-like serine/threonine-protein kinase